MRALSLFSGIGGLDYGLQFAGIHTVLQVENDPWCQRILEHHWPEVARVSDVREIHATAQCGGSGDVAGTGRLPDTERSRSAGGWRSDTGAVDLIHGGFPCQDVSVAGKRAGLSGKRSGLWFEFRRIVSELRPRWVVVENVPGLLSSHRGKDFGVVLRGLADLGYGWAYRVVDARFFGTPQRRRRILVVGCLGDKHRAAQVLAVCESCGGHPAPRTAPAEDLAYTLAGGSAETSRRISNAWNTTYLAASQVDVFQQSSLAGRGTFGYESDADAAKPVKTQGDGQMIVGSQVDEGAARPLVARASGYRMDLESETFVVNATLQSGGHSNNPMDQIAYPLRASDGHHGWSAPRGDGDDNLVVADPISTREQKTYTHEGRNNFRGQNLVQAFDWQQAGDERYRPVRAGDYAGALSETRHDAINHPGGVRRLTPLECERLQGFPDGWTDLQVNGKPIADAHRYRMLGNAVDTVVAQWLGHRLALVDSW